LTLHKQLLIGISLLFLVLLAGIQAIYLSNSREQLEAQLASNAQDAATALSLRLAALPNLYDRAMLEALLNPVFDRGYFREIRVVSTDGRTLARRELPVAQGDVPTWFTNAFPLMPSAAQSLVNTGWRETGRVIVQSHPYFAYQLLWSSAVQTMVWLAIVYAIALLFVVGFLAGVLRPLRALEHTAKAIGEREFRTIATVPRARELASLVAAMNTMSGRLQRVMASEAARAEVLRRAAFVDPLTTLYNRRGFKHQIRSLLRSGADASSSTLAILEFEGFGEFNARAGYQRGDEVISLLARAIAGACEPQGAVCGRLGGASFAVAAIDLDAAALRQLLTQLCHELRSVLAEQKLEDDLRLHCGATRSENALPPFSALLAAADRSLARARSKGDSPYELEAFDTAGEVGSQAWRHRIEEALEGSRFVLYAQNVLLLPGRGPAHAEVTVRMLREGGDPVPAAQFLPMAARHGQVARLDLHVAATLLAHLESRATSLPRVAMNVSARTVADADARARLLGLIEERRGLAPRLIVEMTEFGALLDPALTERFSRDLRRLGVAFALDNFGMRQESLIVVHALKPQYIKLSAGYTRELAGSADCRFFVDAIVRATQPLDIGIYAQAVEDESIVPLLLQLGLAGYQGYAAAQPVRLG